MSIATTKSLSEFADWWASSSSDRNDRPSSCAGSIGKEDEKSFPKFLDIRPLHEFEKFRLKGAIWVDFDVASKGHLFCILPPRSTSIGLCGGEDDPKRLADAAAVLGEIHYFVEPVVLLPCNEGSIDALPSKYPQEWLDTQPLSAPDATRAEVKDRSHPPVQTYVWSPYGTVLWVPSPALGMLAQSVADRLKQRAADDASGRKGLFKGYTMLDIAAGSGRDALYPLLASSPLSKVVSVVVALEKSKPMLFRSHDLCAAADVDCVLIDDSDFDTNDSEKLKPASNSKGDQDVGFQDQKHGAVEPSPQISRAVSLCAGAKLSRPAVLLARMDARRVDSVPVCAEIARGIMPALPRSQDMYPVVGAVDEATLRQDAGFDIVNIARYLDRRGFPAVRAAVNPGGFLIFHQFMEGSFRPKGEGNLLKKGELAREFGPEYGFEVIVDQVEHISDGRPTSIFCSMRKTRQ